MSTKHTPGPWEIERGYGTIIKSIGHCVPDEYAGSAWLEVSEADARRLQPSWNACEGVSTEHLEDDAVRKLILDRDLLLAQRAGLLKALGAILGLLQEEPTAFLQGGSVAGGLDEAAIQAQIEARTAANAAKDWPEADRIRKALLEQGVLLKDGPAGTSWERA